MFVTPNPRSFGRAAAFSVFVPFALASCQAPTGSGNAVQRGADGR